MCDCIDACYGAAKGFAGFSLEDVLDVKVSCLPHHSFASDQYQREVDRLKSSVVEGEGETPAAEVARLLQQVLCCTVTVNVSVCVCVCVRVFFLF